MPAFENQTPVEDVLKEVLSAVGTAIVDCMDGDSSITRYENAASMMLDTLDYEGFDMFASARQSLVEEIEKKYSITLSTDIREATLLSGRVTPQQLAEDIHQNMKWYPQ